MRGLPRSYWFLWAAALVNRLGGFVYTFLALYLHRARHFTIAQAGFVVTLYGLGSFASGPVGGYLADHVGRRRTMLASFVFGALAMLQLGFARAPTHIARLGAAARLLRRSVSSRRRQATVADVVRAGQSHARLRLPLLGREPGLRRRRHARRLPGALELHAAVRRRRGDDARLRPHHLPLRPRDASRAPLDGEAGAARPARAAARRRLHDLRAGAVPGHARRLAGQLDAAARRDRPRRPRVELRPADGDQRHHGRALAAAGRCASCSRYRRAHVLAGGALLQGVGFGLTGAGHTAGWYAGTVIVWTVRRAALFAGGADGDGRSVAAAPARQLPGHLPHGVGRVGLPGAGARLDWCWAASARACSGAAASPSAPPPPSCTWRSAPARRRRLAAMAGDGAAREDGIQHAA